MAERSRVTCATAPDSPRAMVRLLGLFEQIAAAPDGLSLADLSQGLGSPKSSLLTLLRPLTASFHLRHVDGRYHLGPAIFGFAQRIIEARQIPTLLRAAMRELWEKSEETVILTAIDRKLRVVTYVECLDSPQMVRCAVPAGSVRPLYAAAAGQVLLAFQEPEWREAYIRSTPLKAMTARTITDRAALRRRLDEIRSVGIGTSHKEAIPGAAGIAVPLRHADGRVHEALLIAGPSDRIAANQDRLRKMLHDIGARVSADLGHHDLTQNQPDARAIPDSDPATAKASTSKVLPAGQPQRRRIGRSAGFA